MQLTSGDERFEILARLGSGSFGIVYEAFDRYRDRRVALKVLERAVPDAVARFKREFRYLSEIRHPNLASLYELLVIGDKWVLSMERIHGSELLEHLATTELQNSLFEKRGATRPVFDGDQTLRYRPKKKTSGVSSMYFDHVRSTFRQLAIGVAVLHANGIVHRDIKPSNIMITGEGRVVLLDFGLAVEIAREDSIDRKAVVGTPGYMAPEQIKAATPSAASDWYSFGVLLYQALTGQMPFTAPTSLDVMEMQVHNDAPPVETVMPGAPQDLAALADDCIRREPGDRPGDVEILNRLGIDNFEHAQTQRKRDRRPELIARGGELKKLRSWIAAVAPGESRVICLRGSPGSGKSALLDLLLDHIRTDTDAFIVGGRCQAWESVPLNAIDVIVDSLAREFRRERPPAVDAALSQAVAVTQLFPVLPMRRGELDEQTVVMPATGQKLISRAAAELRDILFAAAGDRLLLLVVDDAHWGDFQSAQVLARLLEPQEHQRVVLVLCYPLEDWRTSLLLQSLVGRGIPMHELHLKELSRAGTAAMIKRATGREGRRLVDRIFRHTGGNPTMIEMAIESIERRSADDPALLARAVAHRLQHLSAPAHQLFTWLLSAHNPVDEQTSARALELFEVDEPLRTLHRERLIRIRKTGDLRAIDIYHPRIREAFTFTPPERSVVYSSPKSVL